MNKRKRGSSAEKAWEELEPISKVGRSRGREILVSPQPPQRQKSAQPSTSFQAPSTSSRPNNESHTFLVPLLVGPPPSKLKNSGGGSSVRSGSSKTPGRRPLRDVTSAIINDPPSQEQIRHTNSCRQMRKAVVQVIYDFHEDLKKSTKPDCSGMMENLFICWKKYPLMFASASKVLRLPVDDLSPQNEIQDFLPWWLHGLSSLLFVKELKPYRADIKDLLRTFAQFLYYGNPELVQVCFLELVTILHNLVSSGREDESNNRGSRGNQEGPIPPEKKNQSKKRSVKLNLEFKQNGMEEDGGTELEINFTLLNDADCDEAVCEFIDVLKFFLPSVFQFEPLEKQKFLILLNKLWTQLSLECQIKFVSRFLHPVLPFLPSSNSNHLPLEVSSIKMLEQVLSLKVERIDEHVLPRLVQFFSEIASELVPLGGLSQSFLLRLHSIVARIVCCKEFNRLPSEVQRKGIIQLYLAFIGDKSKLLDKHKLVEVDTKMFLKTCGTLQTQNPLLESSIVSDLSQVFNKKIEEIEGVVNPGVGAVVLNQRNRNPRIVEINSRLINSTWNKIIKNLETSLITVIPFPIRPSSPVIASPLTLETLETSLFTFQTGAKINLALNKHVAAWNSTCQLESNRKIPDFQLLDQDLLTNWTKVASGHIISSFRDNDLESAEKGLNLFVKTIEEFYSGNFVVLKPSIRICIEWVSLCGLSWFQKFKNRLPKQFLPTGVFISDSKPALLEKLSSKTKLNCIRVLKYKPFLPFKDFILEIILCTMETMESAKEILEMIRNFDWPLRMIPWNYLVGYISQVTRSLDWQYDPELRNLIAGAILKLPCIWTNQKERAAFEGIISPGRRPTNANNGPSPEDKIRLDVGKCLFCSEQGKDKEKAATAPRTNSSRDHFIPNDKVALIVRLCLPLLKSRFILVKLELSRVILSVRNHSKEFSPELIVAFCTLAALGNANLGQKVLSYFRTFFYTDEEPVLGKLKNSYSERKEGIDTMFNTFKQFLDHQAELGKSFNYSVKMLSILQELTVKNADQQLTVEIMKFVLKLLVRRDSNVLNMLSQSLVGVMASKANSSPWELITRIRYDLAQEITTLAKNEFCKFGCGSEQTDRFRSFLGSLSTSGDYRTVSIFIHHYYPILLGYIVPSLHEDLKSEFLLKGMAEFASLSMGQLLQDGFYNYYRVLVLDNPPDKVVKCFAFLKSKYRLDFEIVASNILQMSVNEMLSFLDERKDKVVKCIPQLLMRDVGFELTAKNIARSEIQELLSKHLMVFLLFVDTKLHSRLESVSTKARILKSFTVLIELMGKSRMTSNRTKVYTTLNSLFSLGQEFHPLLYEAWRTFTANLENSVFGQMSVQILAAVLTLRDSLPEEVDSLISHFVYAKKELTAQYHGELYFLLDYTKDANVRKIISDCVSNLRNESWGNFFELLVKETRQENSHIRYRAIKKLHDVLLGEHEYVSKMILEREHPVVSQIVNSFLSASRDADTEMLTLLSESFGALGAVDPFRFRDFAEEAIKRRLAPTFTVEGGEFASKYLDLLIREFQEADDTKDFDYLACLIQQVLQHFKVEATANNKVWTSLSPTAREHIEPLLTSKYKVDKVITKPNTSYPIYLSENGKTYDQWLGNWLSVMISHVVKGTKAYQLFKFSKYIIPRNDRIASFLLPFVATYAVIGGTDEDRSKIVIEIENILQRWIDQDKLKANSQMLTPIKETETEEETPPEESYKMHHDEEVFQYRCTQEVFSVFDHLFRATRQANRQAGLQKVNAKMRNPPPNSLILPWLSEQDTKCIDTMLERIPMNTVSQVAFYCEDYKRALFYLEQDLKRYPGKINECLNYLQQLHVSLNDMDSVVGIAAVRNREPTMNEIVLENIAKGKKEAAIRSLECMVSEDPNDLIAYNGLLQAYLSVDEPRKAETLIQGCLAMNPQWEVALQEAQIETTWKLRDWPKLKNQLEECTSLTSLPSLILPTFSTATSIATSTSNQNQPEALSWNINILKILSQIQSSEVDNALKFLKETRLKLMSPLVAAATDISNGYSRGYPNVVQLHILSEVEQAIQLMKESKEYAFTAQDSVKSLITRWDSRLHVLLKEQKFVDPVLNVRKTLLEKLKDSFKGDDPTLELLNGSIRDCWLTVASVESKKGNFTRSLNCLVEAKKYMSPKVMIEHAKLLSKRGEKEQAIKILNSGMAYYFPRMEDWKKKGDSSNGGVVSIDQKLCSKALLLHAKLCDEQQLLDFEENIKNYKSSTEVYRQSEKNFFTLGGYYDRMWSNSEDKYKQSEIQILVVRYYAQSLHYGCKYVYQSLPRLLSIWFDYAAIGYSGGNVGGASSGAPGAPGSTTSQESQPLEWSESVSQMQQMIRKLMKEVPAYVLLTAFSQLISRLCHGNPSVSDLLKEIIGNIICTHPHQTLWMTMAVSKSSYEMRKSRCVAIFKSVERKKPELKTTILDYTHLADKLIELCVKEVERGVNKVSLDKICKSLPKLLNSKNFGNVLIPFQVFMNPSLPPKGSGHKTHDAFPQKFVFIRGVDDTVDIMHSLVRPKKINFIGSNGKRYGILCKAKDDLRKDCKVMEVNSVVNWYLHRNPESRQRQLHVRIYAVTPLNEEHGLLEWVPNLSGIRGVILSILKDKGIIVPMKDLRNVIRTVDPPAIKKQKYQNHFINPFPAVFSEWFLNNFNDPQSWYNARMSYTRTAAVMSIVGYILGLGDRHGENVNLDSSTGDIIHVDFNCLFNKGEGFDCPERVPFRLTQNMTEGMGPLGVEGVFRRSCEITMSMIREHKNIFLSVIRPFVFDPLVEWDSHGYRSMSSTGEVSNGKAVEHMKHIKNRIAGSARNFTKEVNTELSVEAQVAYLIDEARSLDNLSNMYIGWTAFL